MADSTMGDSMTEMYLYETNMLLEDLDRILLNAEKNNRFDDEEINNIFRIMHTIKGSSAMMEYHLIAKVAHKIEDLFAYIRTNGIDTAHNEALCSLVFQATDFLKDDVAKIEEGEPLSEDLGEIEVNIDNFVNLLKGIPVEEEKAAAQAAKQSNATEQSGTAIQVFFEDDCQMENMRAFMLTQQIQDIYPEIRHIPEQFEGEDEVAQRIIQDGLLLLIDDKDKIKDVVSVIKNAVHIKSYEVMENVAQQDSDQEAEEKSDQQEAPATIMIESVGAAEEKEEVKKPESKAAENTKNTMVQNSSVTADHKAVKQSLISVSLNKLDSLMELVGEIIVTESMVASSLDVENRELADVNLEDFAKNERQLRKLTDDLQDIVMSTRMISVSGAFQKMHRIVRDMNKNLNKEVELVLMGEETEVDKTIVDGIADPLMHVVRNSMDHGIEDAVGRVAAGKPAKGTIILSAENTGGEIVITIKDDGKGLDREALLQKAMNRGLLTKAPDEYTDKEVYGLILMPGFSTKEQVSEYSGRGVGMDVVKKNIEKVGGKVFIDSEKGKGMTLMFKIPLTLAIMSCMEFTVGEQIYTIPINVITRSFKVSQEELTKDIHGNDMAVIRENCYSIVKLHEVFGLETEITNLEDGILILVEAGEHSYCIFVDKLLGQAQIVVKPLPMYLNQYDTGKYGISGCTILGDGSVSLILDVNNLIAQN